MVEIKNREDLEKWLEGKPQRWAVTIASRAALRILPLLAQNINLLRGLDAWPNRIVLPTFRAAYLSVSCARYLRDIHDFAMVNSAASTASLAATAVKTAASNRNTDSTASIAVEAVRDAALAVGEARLSTRLAVLTANEVGIWSMVERDAGFLESGWNLWSEPIWDERASKINSDWEVLRLELLKSGHNWEPLLQWYEDRLSGDAAAARADRPSIREMELEIADLPNDVWSDAGRANEAIAEIQARYWNTNGDSGSELAGQEGVPEVPAPNPAALEPIWIGGQLRLPHVVAETSLDQPSFEAALEALRQDIEGLVADARTINNIDQRLVSYLDFLGQMIPVVAPDQASLFRLGHAAEVVEQAQKTVLAEWPDVLGFRYGGIVLAFDRTLKQAPKWKQFKRNAAELHLSEEEKRVVPEFLQAFVDVLREPDVAALVASEVPDELERLQNPEVTPEWNGDLSEASEERLEDAVESASNITKGLLGRFFGGIETGVGDDLPELAGESIGKEIRKQTEEVGPNITKAVKKFVKWAAASGGLTGGAGVALSQFGWLQPVLDFLKNLL